MFCEECGTKNKNGARFCEACGAKLDTSIDVSKLRSFVAAAARQRSSLTAKQRMWIRVVHLSFWFWLLL